VSGDHHSDETHLAGPAMHGYLHANAWYVLRWFFRQGREQEGETFHAKARRREGWGRFI
jgi:hypothetical protein